MKKWNWMRLRLMPLFAAFLLLLGCTGSKAERKLLKDVVLFDVYEGKNLPAGKKSYAVSFFLEDETKTLNDKQIDAIMKKIQTNLEQKLGAQLR